MNCTNVLYSVKMDFEKLLTLSCCLVILFSLAGASWMAEYGDPDTDGTFQGR